MSHQHLREFQMPLFKENLCIVLYLTLEKGVSSVLVKL